MSKKQMIRRRGLSEFLAIFAGNEARQNRDKRMTAFGSNDE